MFFKYISSGLLESFDRKLAAISMLDPEQMAIPCAAGHYWLSCSS
jgi:hypothetical protein